jgi:hypothetical protein
MEAVQLELDLGLTSEPARQPYDRVPHPCSADGIRVDRHRVALMEELYRRDGRDQPDHPHRHTYTGLAEELHTAIGRALVDRLLELPVFTPELILGASGGE